MKQFWPESTRLRNPKQASNYKFKVTVNKIWSERFMSLYWSANGVIIGKASSRVLTFSASLSSGSQFAYFVYIASCPSQQKGISGTFRKTLRNKSLRQTAFSFTLAWNWRANDRRRWFPVRLRKRERILLEVCSFQEKLRWNEKLSTKSNPLKLTEYFVKTQRSAAKRQDA